MKNKNLWLSLLITIGVLFLLTWLIPSTSYGNGDELVWVQSIKQESGIFSIICQCYLYGLDKILYTSNNRCILWCY